MNRWLLNTVMVPFLLLMNSSGYVAADVVAIGVEPGEVQLNQPHATYQLLVDASTEDGSIQDATGGAT